MDGWTGDACLDLVGGCPARDTGAVASGGPGDHWETDLLQWGLPAFGEPIDGLLVEIFNLGGARCLDRQPLREDLWELWPRWGRSDGKDKRLRELVEPLVNLRDRLRVQGQERGWEIH